MMKPFMLLATCVLTFSATFAQNSAPKKGTKPAGKAKQANNKVAVGGTLRDEHKHPLKGVEAFVYLPDSSIGASGFTDSSGYFETNAILPGKYNVKLVYPSEKIAMINGVITKKGVTMINLNMDEPASDTIILYIELLPKPVEKKKGGKSTGATTGSKANKKKN